VHLASGIEQTDCASAWDTLVASWLAGGLGTMLPSGERVVDAKPGEPWPARRRRCSLSVAG
jgi:hypothetical protein